jgi:hypothetical protein
MMLRHCWLAPDASISRMAALIEEQIVDSARWPLALERMLFVSFQAASAVRIQPDLTLERQLWAEVIDAVERLEVGQSAGPSL